MADRVLTESMRMVNDEGVTHYVGDDCEPDGHRSDPDRPDDGPGQP